MRRVTKQPIPQVLSQNRERWTTEFLADPTNSTKKYRYRDPAIKSSLVVETASKCVYCESKIGHNTPGDVEHKIPSSVDPTRQFEWENLTIACTECNRRKNDYYDAIKPFLDPYNADIETRVIHLGPVLSWPPGDNVSEISLRRLELNDNTRTALVARKIEAIEALNNVVARMNEADETIRELMKLKLQKMKGLEAEYSGMLRSICDHYNL